MIRLLYGMIIGGLIATILLISDLLNTINIINHNNDIAIRKSFYYGCLSQKDADIQYCKKQLNKYEEELTILLDNIED